MFENHILTWVASLACCLGIVFVAILPVRKAQTVYQSNLFLPTYMVGILAWLLHGLEIRSVAIIVPCAIQIPIVIFLLGRSISMRTMSSDHEL